MAQLLLTLLVIALAFALLVVFGGRFVVNRVGSALSKRHGETEWILGSGLAPPEWHRRYSAVLHFLRQLGFGSRALTRVKALFKRRLEYRLLGLLRYIEASNVINDETIRSTMAGRLRQIGKQWEESSWEQVTGQDTAPGEEDGETPRGSTSP